jgi:hypothetical protein
VAVGTAAQLVLVLLRVADHPGCAYLRKHNTCVELEFASLIGSARRSIHSNHHWQACRSIMRSKHSGGLTHPFAQVYTAALAGSLPALRFGGVKCIAVVCRRWRRWSLGVVD